MICNIYVRMLRTILRRIFTLKLTHRLRCPYMSMHMLVLRIGTKDPKFDSGQRTHAHTHTHTHTHTHLDRVALVEKSHGHVRTKDHVAKLGHDHTSAKACMYVFVLKKSEVKEEEPGSIHNLSKCTCLANVPLRVRKCLPPRGCPCLSFSETHIYSVESNSMDQVSIDPVRPGVGHALGCGMH